MFETCLSRLVFLLFLIYRVELKVKSIYLTLGFYHKFLIYRVELKVSLVFEGADKNAVPNLPCGVERHQQVSDKNSGQQPFLIYRVELKASSTSFFLRSSTNWFLIYRVELKDVNSWFCGCKGVWVPNLPCGVERTHERRAYIYEPLKVPNLPCGVERS